MTQDTAHMPLDERALEAAREQPGTNHDGIIRAYLQTAAADVSGLVAELAEHIQWNREYEFLTTVEICEKAASTLQTLSARNAVLEAENERLRKTASECHDAIAEYYRYQTGGETRGSYDGKPERDGLWRAMYNARAALSAPKGGQDE